MKMQVSLTKNKRDQLSLLFLMFASERNISIHVMFVIYVRKHFPLKEDLIFFSSKSNKENPHVSYIISKDYLSIDFLFSFH